MTTPTTSHSKSYRSKLNDSGDDFRLTTSVFDRNNGPILRHLTPYLNKMNGYALEIGSGTGQHLSNFAQHFHNIHWQGSDLDELHCKSTDAWAEHYSLDIQKTLKLDASSNWLQVFEQKKEFELIISMNVIHIAPISVLNGIISNATKLLKKNGLLIFYGPFKNNNKHYGEGNKTFDQRLKDENPSWGVRCMSSLRELAQNTELSHFKTIEMPANNHILIFKKLS